MKATESTMLQRWRKPGKLFSDFNTLQFACVMALVVFVMLVVFLTMPTSQCNTSVDPPKVLHPVSMLSADREDVMIVSVTRDGQVYFGSDRVKTADLPQKIADRLKDRDVERKVYIRADMRARWGAVKEVAESVHAAGLMRVAFLADQRRSAALHM